MGLFMLSNNRFLEMKLMASAAGTYAEEPFSANNFECCAYNIFEGTLGRRQAT